MSRKKKEIDFFKYTQLDPEDNEVFFGPITLRELKRSVEVEEEIIKRRHLERKKTTKELSEQLENKENKDDVLNRTFEIDEFGNQSRQPNISQRVLNDVTQFHIGIDEAKLVDLSIQSPKTSMKPPKSVASIKQTKCLLDETVNLNESMTGMHLRTPLMDKVTRSKIPVFPEERKNSESKENVEPAVNTPRLPKLSDTFITDLREDILLNATISDDSGAADRVGTPDIFKQERNDIWKNSPKRTVKSRIPTNKSPVKETTTCFFARSPTAVVATASLSRKKTPSKNLVRLLPKSPGATLVTRSTSERNASVKSQVTLPTRSPAAVLASQSQSTKKKTPAEDRKTLFHRSPAPSKLLSLPKQKQTFLVKDRLFPNSPVADYIHHGKEVKSMSKARHSSCLPVFQDIRSKSDCKIAQSKIPVSTGSAIKRKLDLGEKLHQSLLNSPMN